MHAPEAYLSPRAGLVVARRDSIEAAWAQLMLAADRAICLDVRDFAGARGAVDPSLAEAGDLSACLMEHWAERDGAAEKHRQSAAVAPPRAVGGGPGG